MIATPPKIPASAAENSDAGRDLSDSGELLELEALARPVFATNAEGKRIADDFSEREPDWSRVEARSRELLSQSRDLRVACFQAAALLRTGGLKGFLTGLEALAGFCALGPDGAYPKVTQGDAGAATERWYTLAALSVGPGQDGDFLRIIEGLRDASLARCKEGSVGGQELSDLKAAGAAADLEKLNLLQRRWNSVPPGDRKDVLANLGAIDAAVLVLERCMVEQTPESAVPSGATSRPLRMLSDEIRGWLSLLKPVEEPRKVAVLGQKGEPQPLMDKIQNREEAVRHLQLAREYFLKAEPASPVPFFIDRAIRLVDRDFVTLLNELVPDALPRFQMMAGLEKKDET